MNADKKHIIDLVVNMWYNDLELIGTSSDFEIWCEDNIKNEKQKELMDKVKNHVDAITNIFEDEF